MVTNIHHTCMNNRVETSKSDTPESMSDYYPTTPTCTVLPATSVPTVSPSTSECSVSQTSPSGYVSCGSSSMPLEAISTSVENIDLGALVQAAGGSWDILRTLVNELSADRKKQCLSCHCKPASAESLHSHPVTKLGKTWNVSFQLRWMEKYPWLSYSILLSGGICRYCILFPEQPSRGGWVVAIEQVF